MKKLLTFVLTALCAIVATAQNHWEYETSSYPDATVVYAKVNDGTVRVADRYEIAAFVDGHLRATTRYARAAGTTHVQHIYTLRVEGDNATDAGKHISFRLYDHNTGLEYELSETTSYTGETTVAPSQALSLTLNAAEYIEWQTGTTGELWIPVGATRQLPYTLVGADGMALDEGRLTPFKICNITVAGNTGNYFTLAADGKSITANKVAPATPGTITVKMATANFEYKVQAYVAPTGVEATTQKIMLKVGEEQSLSQYFNVLPAECSLYTVSANLTSDAASYVPASLTESKTDRNEYTITGNIAGTGTVEITVADPNDPNRPFTLSIPYEVRQQVTGIAFRPESVIYTGEEMYLSRWFTVNPGDATDKSVTITADKPELVDITYAASSGLWLITGKKAGNVTLTVTSVSDPEVKATGTIQILQSVEGISVVEPIVMKEEQTIDLTSYITVLPADAYDKTVTIYAEEYDSQNKEWNGTKGVIVDQDNGVWTLYAFTDGEYRLVVNSTAAHSTATTAYISVTVTSKLRGICIVSPSGNVLSDTPNGDGQGVSIVMGDGTDVKVQAMPESYSLIEANVQVSITGTDYAAGWTYVDAKRKGLDIALGGRALTTQHKLVVTYTEAGETFTATMPVRVGQHIDLPAGWSWSQPFAGGMAYSSASVDDVFNGAPIIEMRTQNALLYNDPEWGLWGDIYDVLMPSRIKMSADYGYDYYCQPSAPADGSMSIQPRWNWISYPYMYEHSLSEIYSNNCGANEGDVIKTQTGFSTYEDGAWTNNLQLHPGESMAYYNASGSKTVVRPIFAELSQPASTPSAAPRRLRSADSPWQYDPRQFMDNMGMVAAIDFADDVCLDDYTVGAFVGGECRGEGRLNNGRWFVTIYGQSNDVVTLKLMNLTTGEVSDLEGCYTFAAMMGSTKEPVRIAAPETETGIAVNGASVLGRDVRVFSLNGVEVTGHNGHLTPGVYVVKSGTKTTKVTIK